MYLLIERGNQTTCSPPATDVETIFTFHINPSLHFNTQMTLRASAALYSLRTYGCTAQIRTFTEWENEIFLQKQLKKPIKHDFSR